MQKVVKSLFIFYIFSFLFACKKEIENTAVQIRVQNGTAAIFFDCIINPSDGSIAGTAPHNYGRVAVDSSTAYYTFPKAYRYAAVKLTMNNAIYLLQPYDYVGETPLTQGKYTYRITYAGNGNGLNITLIKD